MLKNACACLGLAVFFSLWIGCADPSSKTPTDTETASEPAPADDAAQCNTGSLPGNFATTGALDLQPSLDFFSWSTFLYLNTQSGGSPVWSNWSSSVDLLKPIEDGASEPTPYGTHYYPEECQSIDGYQNYRVIDQVDKVNDSLFEAKTQGLSGDPVVDSNGNFIRYEILLSEATYNDIASKGYYTASGQAEGVNLICADTETNTGPSDPHSGAMNLKLAWMENPAAGHDAGTYYSEEFLVYTPADMTSNNQATCTLTTHYLVGMHIARKTQAQQAWIWSTFEHANNAPNCTDLVPAAHSHEQNTSCPALTANAYNFTPSTNTCTAAGDGACASCNSGPASNCSSSTGYCVDAPPAAAGGYSTLCRQVDSYDTSTNTTCQAQEAGTVWANYDLISTQWFSDGDNSFPSNCDANQSSKVYDGSNVSKTLIRPQVTIQNNEQAPYLANTSMESYERSNCMGCHSKAVQSGTEDGPSTDFVYYLMLEVGQ